MDLSPDAILTDRFVLRLLAQQPRRCRQLLYLILTSVVLQRRSATVIPDVAIAETKWGNQRSRPQRWRREIKKIVDQLPEEFVEHAELRPTRVNGVRKCPECCSLHNSDVPHRHFVFFATEKLTGSLEHYRRESNDTEIFLDRPIRLFDFNKPKDREIAEIIKPLWSDGTLAYLHGPSLVYGSATWSGLSALECDVWQAVFGELTKSARSSRTDRARVLRKATCSLLSHGRHVVFAGNFKNSAPDMNGGYRLIGETNRGWLYKTGFSLRKSGRPLDIDNRPCIRDFLRPLQQLEQKFSLTAATSMNGKWLGIDTLLQLANSRSRADWNMLMELRVCVFAPEDYLDRIQTYFRKQGRFPATSSSDSLAFRINTSGMKKKEIAELIGISPSALSEFLSGRRNWPKEVAKRLEGVLSDVPPGENFSKNGSN